MYFYTVIPVTPLGTHRAQMRARTLADLKGTFNYFASLHPTGTRHLIIGPDCVILRAEGRRFPNAFPVALANWERFDRDRDIKKEETA